MTHPTEEPRPAAHTGPLDFSELAHGLVQRMTGEDEGEDAEESPQAVAGRKGGEARAKALPAARRSEIARQGAAERWAVDSE